MRSQRGFTLTELMIVVAIIGIFSALLVGLRSGTYGVNAKTEAEQVAASLNFARTRALATRKIHRVEIHPETSPQMIYVYAAATTGMATSNLNTATMQSVIAIKIPPTVKVWSVVSGAQPSGQSPAQSAALYSLNFRPDGSSDGAATVYLTENTSTWKNYRVLTYQATGSSYARTSW